MSASQAMDPALAEFIAEGNEIVARVAAYLQEIESQKGRSTPETLSALYRDVHTLKGNAQLYGLLQIGLVAHAMEACLDPIRKSGLTLPDRIIESCLRNLDLISQMLRHVEETENDKIDSEAVIPVVTDLIHAASALFKGDLFIPREDLPLLDTDPSTERANLYWKAKPPQFEASPPIQASMKIEGEETSDAKDPMVTDRITAMESAQAGVAAASDSTIRVHVGLLDRILNLVGELVLVRNQFLQDREHLEDPEFLATTKALDVVTSDLQGEVMKTRMQPIESIVGKFQRVVRDMARELDKRIDLTLEGADTELDKSLLEAVMAPLTHIVRNSCDHGIEGPAERKKVGKPENGHLLIRSYHEGGQVVIEVSDDGRGLNRARIKEKALEKGLVTKEQVQRMTDRQVCELIFRPNFSTASQVTTVSGRGVGMDVVKTNIERIGGHVELSSFEGKGTTVQLRIPLTLAIVPALLVKSSTHRFAIPQVKLVELVRAGSTENESHIEYLQGRPMYRLRGVLLPLFDIREITGEKGAGQYTEGANIVVVDAEGEKYGLIVGEISDTADIVVKPISSFLKHLNIFSGATILGDGTVSLILDVAGVAQYGRILGKRTHGDQTETFSKDAKKSAHFSDIQEFLLFSVGVESTHALPLCLVQRLEVFQLSDIEVSGSQRLIKYRGQLLPLLNLAEALQYNSAQKHTLPQAGSTKATAERISVIVVSRSGRMYGLWVNEIVDIVTIDGMIDDTVRDRMAILGNIVFHGEVIVVVDALGIIERFNPQLKAAASPQGGSNQKVSLTNSLAEIKSLNRDIKLRKIRVIYAEDVAFFRRHVSKVLNEAGIDITTVEDGAKALEELNAAEPGHYNLILSDIEMPNMTGLELARAVRQQDRFKKIPMIALTTRFRSRDIEEGSAAGFNVYLEKLNPEKLLAAIDGLMRAPNEQLNSIQTKEASVS